MKVRASLIATCLSAALPALAQSPVTLQHSVFPTVNTPPAWAREGYSLAVDGNFVVAGSFESLTSGPKVEQVLVYSAATGAMLHTLNNPAGNDSDNFGHAVAISGTKVVVGAYANGTGASSAGRAYVYDLSSGTPTVPIHTLNNPAPAASDRFGYSVGISGNLVVVGAYQDDTGATNAGSAYVYDLNSGTPTTPVHTLDNPAPAASDLFGAAVAISGTRVVIGAYQDDTGATDSGTCYVYDVSGGTPTMPVHTLDNPGPAPSDRFGFAVSITAARVIVGASQDDTGGTNAGSAYVYDLGSGTPTTPAVVLNNPAPASGDAFGSAVAVSGAWALVGVPLDNAGLTDSGTAYAYDLGSVTPTAPAYTINNPGVGSNDQFGFSVALSGNLAAIGVPNEDTGAVDAGNVCLFNLPLTLNKPAPAAADLFGFSVSVSGNLMVTGAPFDDTGATDAGSAYVYDLTSGTPTVPVHVLNNPSPAANDQFGYSVTISGTKVVVGAPFDNTGATDAGSAYVYDLGSGTPTVPVHVLNNPGPAAADYFGYSVAISGTRVVIGAYGNDTTAVSAGSAYVYDLSGGTPTVPVHVLDNPDPAASDFFGRSVAVSGMQVVIGANLDDTGAADAGCAYVYDLGSGTPTAPVHVLNNPGPVANDQFGHSVAVSGTRVVIGANLDDTGATDAGSAYVYDLTSGTPTVPVHVLNNPSPAASDQFGYSVTISGTKVVVGAPFDDTGATDAGCAYVYDLGSGTPTAPVHVLNNPGPLANDQFGNSVAVSGTRVVIGAYSDDTGAISAGSAYAYDINTPAIAIGNARQRISDYFGFLNAVSVSGTKTAVGAFLDDTGAPASGAVYVFDTTSGTPTVPVNIIPNPGPGAAEQFGYSVALHGQRLVVGSDMDNGGGLTTAIVYVFDLGSGTPATPAFSLSNPTPVASDLFGSVVAVSGPIVVVGASGDDTGASNAGIAYVYDLTSATPTTPVHTLNNPGPATSDNFGESVAISGNIIVVGCSGDDTGASNAGIAYVYDLMSATPATPVYTLTKPGAVASDNFGVAVAVSNNKIVIGSTGDDTGASGAGSAYVYDLTSATPTTPVHTLNNPSPAANDAFGRVAISGNKIVVGTAADDTGGSNAGIAYLFDLSGATPESSLATFNNPTPAASDSFGLSVSIDGNSVAIGAYADDTSGKDRGAAYLFAVHPDLDGDGLLDAWELSYWPTTAGHGPLDDFDSDGYKDLLEMAMGFNPTISNPGGSPGATQEGGYLTMTLTKQPGVSYAVQTAGTLITGQPDSFSTTSTTILINNATTLKVRDNVLMGGATARFVRVQVTGAP